MMKINPMFRRLLTAALIALCVPVITYAQFVSDPARWVEQLDLKAGLPDKLLSTRSAVFHDFNLTPKETKDLQEYFQRTGIDAVVYFELDKLTAGADVSRAFGDYLNKREITNIVFVEKGTAGFRITITTFNGKETVIDANQKAWSSTNTILIESLKDLYRTASSQQKKQNLLINDKPETALRINPILGKRNEFFAIDAKVDPLAVQKTGDPAVDQELEAIFAANYSLKYKIVEPGTTEKDMRKQGLLYVVCVIRTRDVVAKDLLGYDMTKVENEIISVSYPDGPQQSKNIPANTVVYKFYFKHIDSQNVFLGTKWDADLTWQEALFNQLRGMKTELRLN